MSLDMSPVFYTTEELEEIKNKIRLFMKQLCKLQINKFDNDVTRNCKITAIIANDAKQNNFNEKIVNAYINYPPFMFYTDSSHSSIRRICGFGITTDGEIVAHAITAMFIVNDDVVGGVDLDECVHVKYWSESQLDRLTSGLIDDADSFLKQDGYMCFAR